MSQLKHWFDATRPKTLPASWAPIILGGAYSFAQDFFDLTSFLVIIFTVTLIQIGTNFANDYYDFKKGADTDERVGPIRASAAGLIKAGTMKGAFITTFLLSALCGLYLVYLAGWPIFLIGLISIACGILYTGGPYPLAYLGLGDLFVFIFFGPVAVVGTVFIQAVSSHESFDLKVYIIRPIILSIIPASLSTAIIVVNNLRDRYTDVKANKKTLAVWFGEKFTKIEYALLLSPSILVNTYIFLFSLLMLVTSSSLIKTMTDNPSLILTAPISLLLLVQSLYLIRAIFIKKKGQLNKYLGETAKHLLFECLFISYVCIVFTKGLSDTLSPLD